MSPVTIILNSFYALHIISREHFPANPSDPVGLRWVSKYCSIGAHLPSAQLRTKERAQYRIKPQLLQSKQRCETNLSRESSMRPADCTPVSSQWAWRVWAALTNQRADSPRHSREFSAHAAARALPCRSGTTPEFQNMVNHCTVGWNEDITHKCESKPH